MAAPNNPWSDFETVLGQLRQMTVPSLKGVITGLVDQSAANIGKTGKKSELQERILRSLRVLQSEGKVDKWLKARAVILQVASGTEYDPSTLAQFQHNQGATTSAPRYPHSYAAPATSTSYYSSSSRPVLPAPSPLRPSALPIPRWRNSPFYRIDQAASHVHECPESSSSTDRRSSRFNFYLTGDQIAKLQSRSGHKYQLRLYCTTSQYYITVGTSFRNNPCPIEFPPTCEVRINGQVLTTANFRGIKKKAGTAPPADITNICLLGAAGVGNQVEMIYVNSNQQSANKQKLLPQKYYLVVNLVEMTSVTELVERLRKRVQPKEKTIANIQAQQVDDDEVQAGPTKLSLRDPLTYTRLNLPCRSAKCVHVQCFDANRWYTMMEQTTTWLCPICDRVLEVDDLIIDEFVSEILQQVPDDTDDVMVEADGEWHTEDNQYGSPSWMRLHGVQRTAKSEPASPPSTKVNSSEGAITIGDSSDSEEEQEVKRELSAPGAAKAQATANSAASVPSGPVIIDLTLSDSDDDTPIASAVPPPVLARPPPPPSVLGKRKLSSDGELAAGSSRRTSTATSHRSTRVDEDDYNPHHDRHFSANTMASNGRHSVPLHSPSSPLAHLNTSASSSPAMHHYSNGNALSSPTNISHGAPQWSPQSRAPQYPLPPASSLMSTLPNPLPSPPSRPPPLLPPPPPVNRQNRAPYDNNHRHSSHGASSEAASRYAEWGYLS